MRLVFLGSGAFGIPTLEALARRHEVALVVSQPDRPAGRGRHLAATPVSEFALARGLPLLRSEEVNAEAALAAIEATGPECLVVIAFGQKLAPPLAERRFAVNLHGSLLPRHRGAAPVQRAILAGDETTGVTVITLARRMDAGLVLASAETPIGPRETAGELHDRLAALGPDLVLEVLAARERGDLEGCPQDESRATRAPKLSRADAWVRFDGTARMARCRINGLSPWPGCAALVAGAPLRLLRAEEAEPPAEAAASAPGTLLEGSIVACGEGAVRLLEVQPPGGRAMSFEAWRRGRGVGAGTVLASIGPEAPP